MSTIVESSVSSMFDLAEDLLTAVAEAMATTAAGAPVQSYVSLGAPAWETLCSKAVVQVLSLTEEQTRDTSPAMQPDLRHFRGRVNLIGMVAYAMRCVKVSGSGQGYTPVNPAVLTAEAKASYEDGWAVWNHVTRQINDGTLFPNGGPCYDAHFDAGVPYTPAGGLGGWQFTLRAELGGYTPAGDV